MGAAKPQLSVGRRLVAERSPRFAALRIAEVLKQLVAFGAGSSVGLVSSHSLSRWFCHSELSIALGRAGPATHSSVKINKVCVCSELPQNDPFVDRSDMTAAAAIAVQFVPAKQIHDPRRDRHIHQVRWSNLHFSKYVSHGLEDLSAGSCGLPP